VPERLIPPNGQLFSIGALDSKFDREILSRSKVCGESALRDLRANDGDALSISLCSSSNSLLRLQAPLAAFIALIALHRRRGEALCVINQEFPLTVWRWQTLPTPNASRGKGDRYSR
jgi:hypothetical protein